VTPPPPEREGRDALVDRPQEFVVVGFVERESDVVAPGSARARPLRAAGDDVVAATVGGGDDHLVDRLRRAQAADIVCEDVLAVEREHHLPREAGRPHPRPDDRDDVHGWW